MEYNNIKDWESKRNKVVQELEETEEKLIKLRKEADVLKNWWKSISPKGTRVRFDKEQGNVQILTAESNYFVFDVSTLQYALIGGYPEDTVDFVIENYPQPIYLPS